MALARGGARVRRGASALGPRVAAVAAVTVVVVVIPCDGCRAERVHGLAKVPVGAGGVLFG